jgi:hypothetical protein
VQWQLPGDQSDAMVSGRASLGRSLDYDGPQPNMSIEEPLQSRNTSQWHFSSAGEMISPTISMESFLEPIQVARGSTDEGGITSAIGFPKRVTRMGFFVLRTCCSSETLCFELGDAHFLHSSYYQSGRFHFARSEVDQGRRRV